jgi:hypothetical protein
VLVVQVLFWQQPLGQLVGVQRQEPDWHSVPAGQAMQAMPAVPQCWLLLVWQVLFWQQPLGQLAAVQTQALFWHSSPAGQLTHATPPVPHAVLLFPGWQMLFRQQPLGHAVELQTQLQVCWLGPLQMSCWPEPSGQPQIRPRFVGAQFREQHCSFVAHL